MKFDPRNKKELENLLIKLSKDKNLFHDFLNDLLTPGEFHELALRLQIVKQLDQKLPHRDIAKNLKTSIATITRGSRELADPKGGFRKVLDKYYSK